MPSEGWRRYVPPILRSTDGLLRYYVAVLPLVVPAALLLVIGGEYALYGAYATVAIFVGVSIAYSVWLWRSLRAVQDPDEAQRSRGRIRNDRPGHPSSPRGPGDRPRVRQ
ncbi:hypothetical protein [Longibacter sp.]|uniref:hypothetical protein n=1 Tax=Longibacter sp. TaxID=2045415 RepID=UPI003EC0FC5D